MAEQERLFTLPEAHRELGRRECASRGHDYNIILAADNNSPVIIRCRRCGRGWDVSERNETISEETGD